MRSSVPPVPAAITSIVAGLLSEGTAPAAGELSALLRRPVAATIAPAPPGLPAGGESLRGEPAAISRVAGPAGRPAVQVALEFRAREQPPAEGSMLWEVDATAAAALAALLPGQSPEDPPDASEQAALLELGAVVLGELLDPLARQLGFSPACGLPRLRSTPGPDPDPAPPGDTAPSAPAIREATLALTLDAGSAAVRTQVRVLAGAEQWEAWESRLSGPEQKAAA